MEILKKKIQEAVNLLKDGNLAKSEKTTLKLIETNSKIPFLYNLLGLILAEQKKTDQAIKCYEKGIALDPNYGMIYNNMGLLFYKDKSNDGIKKAEIDKYLTLTSILLKSK